MFKMPDTDRANIEKKYHIPEKEFNPFYRMNYHGYDYDEATGLSDEALKAGVKELSAQLEGLPHPVHKAKLFEYVLENTRIDVNEHDYFIGLYSWSRVISPYTVHKWETEVIDYFPEYAKTLYAYDDSGTAFGWLDFDHTIPDWESLMELGFSGILKRAEECYEKIENPTEKQAAFFEGLKIEYNAIIAFIDRLYQYARTKTFAKAAKIAECLKSLRGGAPKDIYEAMQMIFIYFMLSESVDHYQVRSLGYCLDATLYPFFKRDIESGRYNEDDIREFLSYFLMQWSAIGNYWGQPFTLAGTNLDGTTKVNELSYLILDTYDKLGIYNPKIHIKISKATPKEFVLKALEMIRHGVSSIVFCNEDIITKALMRLGAGYEEAVDSVISGCYEYKCKRKNLSVSTAYMNVLKPISYVFDNGFDEITGKKIGTLTGNVEEFSNFDEFYNAYLEQLAHGINTYLGAMMKLETRVGEINPSLMYSGTIPACVETMTDALDGGIDNNTSMLLCGIGTAVDALMAVRQLVFEDKVITLQELKKALDVNWEGYETLHAKALSLDCKYGNGNEVADKYAADIVAFVDSLISDVRNSHGGRITILLHSARAFIIHGAKTKATPDGRLLGDEISKNASPTPGADRNGITALINSATTIDTTLCTESCCLDVMLHPSAVQGENGLAALYAVLCTYMEKGGASLQFNIFNSDILRDAQKHPEKYKTLQVRICGWNAFWNNIDKKEQDAYIKRAESVR